MKRGRFSPLVADLDMKRGGPSFAYLFERFPSFVQTFVYREAVEMVRQQMNPWLISIRQPDDPGPLAEQLSVNVFYAPEEKQLRAEVDAQRAARQLPMRAHRAIPRHRTETDAQRMFEAIWLAPKLRERGVRHLHAHFGGVAARTAWWLRKLYGFSYSFTGHANDIFCATNFPVSNEELVRGACFVVTETDFARRWMEERYPHARGRIFRIFNGIAMDSFPERAAAGDVPQIISVGRSVEKKGFNVLIEACRLLAEKGIAFRCRIVGGGPLEQTLEKQITAAGLSERVQLCGPRAQSEVRRMLAESQIFALACVPERDGGSDNLPTAVMEAMASALPVVSTKMAGIPEMVADGEDGLLVPPEDAPSLASALETLLKEPELARQMGECGRRNAVARFSISEPVRELKRLLIARAAVIPPKAARVLDPQLPHPKLLARIAAAFR